MRDYSWLPRRDPNYDRAKAEGASKITLNITSDVRRPEGFQSYLLLTEEFADALGFAVIRKAIVETGTYPEMSAAWLKWRLFNGENFNAAE